MLTATCSKKTDLNIYGKLLFKFIHFIEITKVHRLGEYHIKFQI